ncbi:unnamed protein product [Miscanthus lutarioriparius]|uniref:Transposase-associated domain-containing protein n=1 Tax=Miscanthus lutarioriparius TaxID=422564 RepID=A0A811MWT2_9POAL|nr:unnamed protein product [Miscanthus lutarioriparius]
MADREWMYSGWKRGRLSNEWVDKTKEFLDHAFSIPELVESDTIKCPCSMCWNYFRHKRPRIEQHLCHNGFKENYQTWTAHGERQGNHNLEIGSGVEHEGFGEIDRMDAMLVDLAGELPSLVDETPTGFAEAFYRMVVSADEQKRSLGQESREKNPDGAQNRGGSRPLVETQQYLEAKHGPGKGTIINAFSCMKAGLKNCDANGNAGPIPERAKKLVDDYNEALQEKYLENWQEQPFDGNGAVNKATIIDAAKASGTRPATSRAFQNLLARYEESLANVGRLTEQNNALLIINKVQIEIPPDLLQEEENDMGGTIDGSSRASANMGRDNSDGH